ncbi:MAG: hypothetical protein E7557_07070 [Ruminococcaceae bacterium]|nr:hypothetical protein [Oscillospiraceae bacterium]
MTNLLLSANMGFLESLGTSGLGFGLVIAVLAALAIFVLILSSFFRKSKKKESEPSLEASATTVSGETESNVSENEMEVKNEPIYNGYVTLDSISEQDAAVVMAITSHKTGIPLEKLGFCSIKLKGPELINISEQDAAAVMAITSHKTGIPLENLYFKSIRLMED